MGAMHGETTVADDGAAAAATPAAAAAAATSGALAAAAACSSDAAVLPVQPSPIADDTSASPIDACSPTDAASSSAAQSCPLLAATDAAAAAIPAAAAGTSPDSPEDEDAGRAGIGVSAFNVTINLIGSGMLAMPWALRVSSLFSGLLLMLLVCIINGTSMLVLAKCCDLTRAYHYGAIGTRALGRRGGLAIQVVMLSYTACSCLSFVTLLGDFLPSAILALRPDGFGLEYDALRAYVILIISATVLAPLSLTRTLYSLRFTSAISLAAIMFTLAMALGKLHGRHGTPPGGLEMFAFPVCSWRSLAVLNCAFTAHYNTPRMYLELRQRSLPRFALVVALGMVAALVIYVATAVAGYVQFGAATQGDMLENYGTDDRMAIAARMSLAVGMAFSFPLCFHAMRTSVLALAAPDLVAAPVPATASAAGSPAAAAAATTAAVYSARKARCLFVGWTLGLVAVTVALGIALTRIEVVMGYKGSVFGCALAHFFPALMFLRLRGRALKSAAARRRQRLLASSTPATARKGLVSLAESPSPSASPPPSSSCPFAWASSSGAPAAGAGATTTARSPMLSPEEREAAYDFEQDEEDAEDEQQQQQQQHEVDVVYSLVASSDAHAHASPTPSPAAVAAGPGGSSYTPPNAATRPTQRRAQHAHEGSDAAKPSLASSCPKARLLAKQDDAHQERSWDAAYRGCPLQAPPLPMQVGAAAGAGAGSLNDDSFGAPTGSLFQEASSRSRSRSRSVRSGSLSVDSSLAIHVRDRALSSAASASSSSSAPTSWGSDPRGLVTLESRATLVAVWLMLAWGVALGTMGLVVNVVVQTGGLKHCA